MFRAFPAHHQELNDSSMPLVLPSYRGDSRAVVRGRAGQPDRPRTQHDCHHDTKVKSEAAAAAVIELLMMGGKTPEIC